MTKRPSSTHNGASLLSLPLVAMFCGSLSLLIDRSHHQSNLSFNNRNTSLVGLWYRILLHLQVEDHFEVNGREETHEERIPPATSSHGSHYYNKTLGLSSWWWGDQEYNETVHTVLFRVGIQYANPGTSSIVCTVDLIL